MKSQKGVTMLSLIIYVTSFLAVTGVVAAITTFFYNNMKVINTDIGSSAYYNKLNLYMVNEVKKSGNKILKYTGNPTVSYNSESANYITFQNAAGQKNTFVKQGDILYYNKVALCKNVSKFEVVVDQNTGKTVVKVLVTIDGTSYSTDYVLGV